MSFISTLSKEDLALLRSIVYRTWQGHPRYPGELRTPQEADRIIESLGPIVVEKLLKTATDQGYRKKTFILND